MGGKALQRFGIFTERKNTEEFERIGKEIQRQISDDNKGILKTKIVTCYHNKADHGDLDLLLKIDKNFSALNEDIKKYSYLYYHLLQIVFQLNDGTLHDQLYLLDIIYICSYLFLK